MLIVKELSGIFLATAAEAALRSRCKAIQPKDLRTIYGAAAEVRGLRDLYRLSRPQSLARRQSLSATDSPLLRQLS
jgi:hypothetical protein